MGKNESHSLTFSTSSLKLVMINWKRGSFSSFFFDNLPSAWRASSWSSASSGLARSSSSSALRFLSESSYRGRYLFLGRHLLWVNWNQVLSVSTPGIALPWKTQDVQQCFEPMPCLLARREIYTVPDPISLV